VDAEWIEEELIIMEKENIAVAVKMQDAQRKANRG
jgi:hypothetical protein